MIMSRGEKNMTKGRIAKYVANTALLAVLAAAGIGVYQLGTSGKDESVPEKVPSYYDESLSTENTTDNAVDAGTSLVEAELDSNSDKTAPGYLNSTYIAKQQLPVELRIVEREDSGYVVSLMADENIVEAESFVTGMGIASSDFSMQKTGEQVRFLSKGKGHGLGFSQYGGNKLAKEGKNWKEILNTYFPLMDITKN